MDELKKQIAEIYKMEQELKPLVSSFQEIEWKWQIVWNDDLDSLTRIYTKLLLSVPKLIGETKCLDRLLKNARGIDTKKKRSETIDGKKVYSSMDEAKAETDIFYQDELIDLIKLETFCEMYKWLTEAVAERIRGIKIFLAYNNKQSFN